MGDHGKTGAAGANARLCLETCVALSAAVLNAVALDSVAIVQGRRDVAEEPNEHE